MGASITSRGATRLAIIVGGMVGTALRVALTSVPQLAGLPSGTLVANVVGSLLLGFVVADASRRGVAMRRLTPVTGGLLGAMTTFSAFVVESALLLEDAPVRGLAYIALSLVAGLAAVTAGRRIGASR